MMTVSFLISLALWAIQTKIEIGSAIILVLTIFLSRYRLNKPIENNLYWRLLNLTIIALLSYILWLYNSDQDSNPIYILLRDIPFFLLPLFFLQLLDKRPTAPIGHKRLTVEGEKRQGLDCKVITIYAFLLSAGHAATDRYTLYIVWCIALLSLFMNGKKWQLNRSFLVILLFALSAVIGVFAFRGIQLLSEKVSDMAVELLKDLVKDPFKIETSIGEIGHLKLTDKILFRIQSANAPLLLMESNFESPIGKSWTTYQRNFAAGFTQKQVSAESKTLSFYSDLDSISILPLPLGVERIIGIEPDKLLVSPNQVVKYVDHPSHAHFSVRYSEQMDSEVTARDYQVPEQHKVWLKQIATQINHGTPVGIKNSIAQYFEKEHYTYSLDLGKLNNANAALEEFMLRRKSGHCEYYAAATTLLFRQLGVPARLAIGYSVHEWDENQKLYIVRQRHAHAWSIAFIDGHWVNVDNTPSTWQEEENQSHSTLSWLEDIYSNLIFYWHFENEHLDQKTVTMIGSILLLILLAIRFFQGSTTKNNLAETQWTFQHQTLKKLDKKLSHTALKRNNNETLEHWLNRVNLPNKISSLYYQLRFSVDHENQNINKTLTNELTAILKDKSPLKTSSEKKYD